MRHACDRVMRHACDRGPQPPHKPDIAKNHNNLPQLPPDKVWRGNRVGTAWETEHAHRPCRAGCCIGAVVLTLRCWTASSASRQALGSGGGPQQYDPGPCTGRGGEERWGGGSEGGDRTQPSPNWYQPSPNWYTPTPRKRGDQQDAPSSTVPTVLIVVMCHFDFVFFPFPFGTAVLVLAEAIEVGDVRD